MCEEVAPDVFQVNDTGELVLLAPEQPECARGLMAQAVAACPTGALSIAG